MAIASNNPFPSVLVVEGSTPASPASGDQRLFVDTADHKLKRVNSAGSVTTIEGGSGGSTAFSWATKTANYTVAGSDSGILADATSGALTITLPTAAGVTQRFAIKKKDSGANSVTVATTSGQTIDGLGSIVLVGQDASIEVLADGSNWYIVAYGTTYLGTAEAVLASDSAALTTSFADILSLTLAAGSWDVAATAAVTNGSTAQDLAIKLYTGATVLRAASHTYAANFDGPLALPPVLVSPTSSTTYTLAARCGTSGGLIQASTPLGGLAGATVLTARKLH